MSKIITAFVVVLLMLTPTIAQQHECDSYVEDTAGVLKTGLETSISRILAVGAEPRVRIMRTFSPFGNLDLYERHFFKSCPAMQDPDGFKKRNLVTILVSMEPRAVGFYYGADYHAVFDSNWKTVKDRTIIPRLKRGEFDEAMAAGLETAAELIRAYENPVVVPKTNNTRPSVLEEEVVLTKPEAVVPPVIEKEIVVPEREVVRPSTFKLFVILMLVAAVGLMIAITVAVFVRWRKWSRQVDYVISGIEIIRNKCVRAIEGDQKSKGLESTLLEVEDKLETLEARVAESDMELLREKLRHVDQLFDESLRMYAEAENSRDGLSRYSYTEGGFEKIRVMFEEAEKVLKEALEAARALLNELNEFEGIIASASEYLKEKYEALEAARASVFAAKEEGFEVSDLETLLEEASEACQEATMILAGRSYVSMHDVAEKAKEKFVSAETQANGLRDRRNALRVSLSELTQMFTDVTKKRAEASDSFKRMKVAFAPLSWNMVAKNGSTADGHLSDVQQSLKALPNLISMDQQNWEEAELAVAFADKALSEADSLLDAILAQEQSIIASRERLPTEIEAATKDIHAAENFIDAERDDIDADGLIGELKRAKKTLERVQKELKKKKPDYLSAIRDALNANEIADQVLVSAKQQDEAKERKRHLADTMYQEALESIDTTSRYIRNHRSDVSGSAPGHLRKAKEFLDTTSRSVDLDDIIDLSKKAHDEANEALRLAKRNVSDADLKRRREEEEQRRRRRRLSDDSDSFSSSTSWSSSSSSSSDGWGGGGSSSFGSFGNGGGGSSSW